MIEQSIRKLICYGLEKNLLTKRDEIYSTNRILEALKLDSIDCDEVFENVDIESTLKELLDYAVEKGLIEDTVTARDLFDTKLMGELLPRPSEVTNEFWKQYETSAEAATEYYYNLSCNSDYIRKYRIAKDVKWQTATEYGDIDITINLSKPEKSLKEILAAKAAVQSDYPKCMLCKECEGYAGRQNYPARQNHRIIPITINDSDWRFQYSPYVYYNEHCIVFSADHVPMKVNSATFRKLIDFVKLFPHYFVGSNAGLPIVGGSILSHDHFQGGRYTFAMETAPIEKELHFEGFDDVKAGIVKWPASVIRIACKDSERLIELASKILDAWTNWTDESVYIYANTDGEPHNAITPIARKKGEYYELDLALRNNITTEERPLGLYHPNPSLHHIKKENIGLIEVMGLAVLPARLKNELAVLKEAILSGKDIASIEEIEKHAEWAEDIKARYELNEDNIEEILRKEVGLVFLECLKDIGVFKRDEKGQAAFMKFIESI